MNMHQKHVHVSVDTNKCLLTSMYQIRKKQSGKLIQNRNKKSKQQIQSRTVSHFWSYGTAGKTNGHACILLAEDLLPGRYPSCHQRCHKYSICKYKKCYGILSNSISITNYKSHYFANWAQNIKCVC